MFDLMSGEVWFDDTDPTIWMNFGASIRRPRRRLCLRLFTRLGTAGGNGGSTACDLAVEHRAQDKGEWPSNTVSRRQLQCLEPEGRAEHRSVPTNTQRPKSTPLFSTPDGPGNAVTLRFRFAWMSNLQNEPLFAVATTHSGSNGQLFVS